MSLHQGTRGRGRIPVTGVAEAFGVGGEAEQPLEGKARPTAFALGRHEEEVAARLEHPHHLAEEGVVVLDVLEEVDGRHDVERLAPERQLGVARLEHPVAHQLLGGPDVVALEVGAHPGAAPLRRKCDVRPVPHPTSRHSVPAVRGSVLHERVHRLLLLERATVELQLPRFSQVRSPARSR